MLNERIREFNIEVFTFQFSRCSSKSLQLDLSYADIDLVLNLQGLRYWLSLAINLGDRSQEPMRRSFNLLAPASRQNILYLIR